MLAYIHIPWCRIHCPYCAFNVHVSPAPPFDAFVDRVLREFDQKRALVTAPLETVFLGGGSPSLLPPTLVKRLLDGLPIAVDAEITLEANPGEVTDRRMAAWRAAGINRLSIGVQTFQRVLAPLLARGHTVAESRRTVERAATAGFDKLSIDLIFACPGQNLETFQTDLDTVLSLSIPHVSLYGLTLEPGTPLTRAVEEGRLEPATPEVWRACYDAAVNQLRAAGLQRYEVGNFARPGQECLHNTLTWAGASYLGLGPGAHGLHPDGTRTRNFNVPEAYLASEDPTERYERPSPRQQATDRLLAALRTTCGIDLQALAADTGFVPSSACLRGLERGGVLLRNGAHVSITEAGFPVADGVIARLTDSLEATRSGDRTFSTPPTRAKLTGNSPRALRGQEKEIQ